MGLKWNSSPKNENMLKCTPPQAIKDVDEFISSSEQIWRNLELHHLLTNGSSAVNGCRQNEQWKNITLIKKIIHESSTLMSCEMKSYTFLTLLPARTGLAKSLARRPGAIVFSSRATKMYHHPAWRAPLNTGLPRNVPFTLRAHGRTLLQPRPRRRNNVPLACKN